MSQFILDVRVEKLAEYINRFIYKYKGELLQKQYAIKKELVLKEDVGGKILDRRKVAIGTQIEIEKKVGKRYKVRLEFRTDEDDIHITGWPSIAGEEVSAVIIDELNSMIKKVEEKIKAEKG